MKLTVTLLQAQASQQPDNIQITADATATVGDVAEALARSDRRDGQYQDGRELTLARVAMDNRHQALPPDQTLADSGILSGSTIAIAYADTVEATRAGAPVVAELRVLEGPDAGTQFTLRPGTSVIGRSTECDIRLRDRAVSKRHARLIVGNKIEIADLGSSNGLLVGGVRVTRIAVGVGDIVTIGDSVLSVVTMSARTHESTDVAFVRSPRVLTRPEDSPVELPSPPRPRQPVRLPWLMLLAPLLMGAVLFWMLTTRSTSSGTAVFSVIFVAMTPLLMLANFFEQKRQRKLQHRDEVEEFNQSLAGCEEQLQRGHALERAQLERLYPALAECVDAVARHGDVLWSVRPEHPEFLAVRLGTGPVPPYHRAVLPRAGGTAEHRAAAEALAARFSVLGDAPVVANLRAVGGVGISGEPGQREPVARAVVAQLAILHSPAELAIACLTSTSARQEWDWLQWLPHTSSPHSPLSQHLAADSGTGTLLLNRLEELIGSRGGGAAPSARGPLEEQEQPDTPTVPSVVVVVDDTSVDRARLTRIAETGPDVGVYVLWVGDRPSSLPACCRTFASVEGGNGRVGMVREGTDVLPVTFDGLGYADALGIARRLAPLVDAGNPVADESDLPRSVSMISLVGHDAADDPDLVLARWQENHSISARDGEPVPRESASELRAVVGHAGSEPFAIDLRQHGPHALVGGTTGAGKSEFLQAWVLGLAHAYSPDRVTFLFVDYKGGAAFASCLALPHCVGLVTDLSPYLVRRALRSLRAELHHRERLLNKLGKKDLIELEKTGNPECPPSLVIVVDEFAALVSEVPEFVDGVVDVAQRGRSLGLHLVLATQRPAGVIKDNLRANTNLRIALRMADETDSQDVLGSPIAAHFPAAVPGRGAAKTGPGRIRAFQSAFPGARTSAEPEVPLIEVVDLDFGTGRPWKLPEPPKTGTAVAKDIDRLVTTIRSATESATIPAPRRPWLDSLAPIYSLARLNARRDTAIPLGVVDDPDHQAQPIEYYRPDADGHILFVGAGGSGKSTALRTLAAASGITPGGGVVHVYGLDFATGSLSSLSTLPNVGSIIAGEDEERTRRLIGFLTEVVDQRGPRFAAAGASTLDDYRRLASQPDEPRYLLLLDGFTSFRAEYETNDPTLYQRFQRLLLDGRGAGVHVAMTADRPSSVPPSILASFQRRVILRQADEDAYLTLGVPRDVLTATSPPGRAIWGELAQEMQIAVLISPQHARAMNASAAAQAAAIEQLATTLAPHHPVRPAEIAALSSSINPATLPATVEGRPTLGVGDTTLGPVGFDPSGPIMVSGPPQSGRTNAVRWLARSLRSLWPDLELVRLSIRRSPLSELDLWSLSADDEAAVKQVLDSLDARGPLAPPPTPGAAPAFGLVVEYLPDFVGSTVEQPLLKRIQAARRAGCPVIAEGETASWTSAWPLTMEVRNGRTGLLLQPDQSDGETLLRTPLPRTKRADFPPGRGYWVKGGVATKVQLPLAEE